ncbi:MAG: Vibrio phage VvAW1 [Pseudomonadota bacterium]|jgi:hypothetical protein
MTTYNTGNPVGSTDARDLYDNAQALDEAVNSTGSTYTDRRGVSRKTLKWMETAATGVPAVQAAMTAEAAAAAALIGSGVYSDEATGRAAVADGAYFKVIGSGEVAAYEYQRTNSTTSVLKATYPAVSYVNRLRSDANAYTDSAIKYVGLSNTGGFVTVILNNESWVTLPVIVDEAGKMVMGFDELGRVVAKLHPQALWDLGLQVSERQYVGAEGYTFAIIDEGNRVAFALDEAGNQTTGNAAEIRNSIYPIEGQYAFAVLDESNRMALAVDVDGNVVGVQDVIQDPPLADTKKHAMTFTRTDYNGMILSGQSLSVGWDFSYSGVLSSTQPYNNKMLGNVIETNTSATALSPLVEAVSGARAETIASGAANQASLLLNQTLKPWESYRWDYIATANGVGGASINVLGQGSDAWSYGLAGVTKAKQLATAGGQSYAFRALCWLQGETDTPSMPTAEYKGKLLAIKNNWNTDVKAITGQTDDIPMFTYQVMCHAAEGQWNTAGGPVTPTAGLAHYQLARENSQVFLVAPIYFVPYGDGIHLTNHGYRWLGHYYGKAFHRVFVERRPWVPLWPISVKKSGEKSVDVQFHVPYPPLVFDTDLVALNKNFGFDVVTSGGVDKPIASVIKVEWDTIRITCEGTVAAGDLVRYAVKAYEKGIGANNGPRGNLRDSDPAIAQNNGADGKPYPLFNWCVMFSEPVTA